MAFSVFNASRESGGTGGCNRIDVIGVSVTSEARELFCHVKKKKKEAITFIARLYCML